MTRRRSRGRRLADHPDAVLFKLREEWWRAELEFESLDLQADGHPEDHAAQEARSKADDRCRAKELQIIRARAQTGGGVIAKLRLVSMIWSDEPDNAADLETTTERLMCSAAIDAGGLPQHNGGGS